MTVRTSGIQSPATHRNEFPTSLSLLVRLRRQEGDAWREFLELYAPLVVRWCRRRGLDDHDTADVAQEVFSKAARGIQMFRKETPQDSLRGWLCRITHHGVAQFFRGRNPTLPEGGTAAMQRMHQHADAPPIELGGDDARQESRFLYQRAMAVAKSEFSADAWKMFWRVAVDGNTATAVADEMGTTSAAVRQAKSRILRRLKQVVGDCESSL